MTQEVLQGTADRFERSGYPDDVSTGGMGNCTGVLVFDRTTRVTHGAHLTWPTAEDRETLEGMLAEAADEFAGATDVWVYVTGCCYDPSLRNHNPNVVRPAVENLVRSAFPTANFDIRWPPAGISTAQITLDPDTCEATFEFS